MIRNFLATSAAVAAAFLGSCSSSSSDDTPTLVGTAAAGAPIAGTVTVLGANGQSRTASIGGDGRYTVNRSGMTAPYLVRAQGVVGSRHYDIVSASTTGQRTNVTPLTDVIVGNVVGGPARAFFESPVPSLITAEALVAQSDLMRERLGPLMSALGLPADLGFFDANFAANHSGHDALLDLLDVTVDEAASTATIRNIVDDEEITDDLTDPTDATVLAVSDPDAIAAAAAALPQAMQATKSLGTLLQAPGPLASSDATQFQEGLSDDFLHAGLVGDDAVELVMSDDPFAILTRRRLADDLRVARLVSISPNPFPSPGDPAEAELETPGGIVLVRDTGDGWRLVGDQLGWASRVDTEFVRLRTQSDTVFASFLVFEAAIPGSGQNEYVLVQGPGIPGGTFALAPEPDGVMRGEIALDSSAAAAIEPGSTYFFTRRLDVQGDTVIVDGVIQSGDGDDQNVQTVDRILPLAPLAPAEPDFALPQITAPTLAALGQFSSGDLQVQWTRPAGHRSRWVTFGREGGIEPTLDAFEHVGDNATQRTLTGVPAAGAGAERQQVTVTTIDAMHRVFTDIVEADVPE